MLQRARQDALGARVLETQLLARVDDKPGALVIAQGPRVIEGPGVDPEAPDRALPGPVDRRPQQERPETAPDEFGDQPEIAQLGLLRRRGIQFEIAGWDAADSEDEDFGRGLPDLGAERAVGGEPALVPQP